MLPLVYSWNLYTVLFI